LQLFFERGIFSAFRLELFLFLLALFDHRLRLLLAQQIRVGRTLLANFVTTLPIVSKVGGQFLIDLALFFLEPVDLFLSVGRELFFVVGRWAIGFSAAGILRGELVDLLLILDALFFELLFFEAISVVGIFLLVGRDVVL